MKEHGIIFTAPMIPPILAGDKTQTRRVMKPQPPTVSLLLLDAYNGGPQWNFWTLDHKVCNNLPIWKCPYGVPGNKLWVRETWAEHPDGDGIIYRATDPGWDAEKTGVKWRSPRFMPRWASRILLEVTEVCVQRVQDISEEDAKAEGAQQMCLDDLGQTFKTYKRGFEALWDTINKKRGYGWALNPWVWDINFKLLEVKK